jgi:hypothetical protein
MPHTKPSGSRTGARRPQVVPLEHAGKWVAWSSDGLRIVASGVSFSTCERAAVAAGFAADQVAIERVPQGRLRATGSSA